MANLNLISYIIVQYYGICLRQWSNELCLAPQSAGGGLLRKAAGGGHHGHGRVGVRFSFSLVVPSTAAPPLSPAALTTRLTTLFLLPAP